MKSIQDDFKTWLIKIRRDLHRYPEISFSEQRSSVKVADILHDLDVKVSRFTDITGVLGFVQGAASGPTMALRADIDALPICELKESSYKSVNEGIMHACGHDANTAIMLGVAKKIADNQLFSRMQGNVKFLFQPAEEVGTGAKAMIERGVLRNPTVDRVIAGHMSPVLKVGEVGIFRNLGYASTDRFELKITGQGAHAARPDEGNDPIIAGACLVNQLQTIVSRNLQPSAAGVVTVAKFQAGEVANAIPESCSLEGSIRALTATTREQIIKRFRELVAGLEMSFAVTCDLQIHQLLPVGINDTDVAEFLFEVTREVLGDAGVSFIDPIMGSEDFSFFAQACPSAIIRLGCANSQKGITAPLHSPYFDIDEDVLTIGSEIFYRAVEKYLT